MSSRRVIASRANGSLSRGPVTAEGKRRSSMNAVRHGLLAKCIVLEKESRDGFDAILNGFIERFGPVDEVELGLVEEMLTAFWRQRRAWAIETRTLDEALDQQPPGGDAISGLRSAFSSTAKDNLELIHRYETRLHRIFQRALRNLMLMRSPVMLPDIYEMPNEPNPISGHSAPETSFE